MSAMHQFGVSASGLMSQKLRDLDAAAPRPPLPPRALPDDVRRRLKLPDRAVEQGNGHIAKANPALKAKADRYSLPPDRRQIVPRQRFSDHNEKKVSPYLKVPNS